MLTLKVSLKHDFFANLKKCHFHLDEIHFLGFVMLTNNINIKKGILDAIKV